MKTKKLFKYVFILMYSLNVFNLSAQIQNDEIYESSSNSYFTPEKYIFLNKTTVPINTIQNGVNGWTYIDSYSDEFNLSTLNQSKWRLDYGYMNNGTSCMAYHKLDLSNHKLLTEGSTKFLRLETKMEYLEKALVGYEPDTILLDDRLPNKRPFYMSSAMIQNINDAIEPYGYYEINCRIPASRFIIVDFWLWGVTKANGDTTTNDMNFEINNARNCYVSTNLQYTGSPNIRHYSNVITVDKSLKNDFNTLAFKWERQRITFYLNNEIIYTVTQDIPNSAVQMKINLGQELGDSFYGSPFDFPNYYDINYIRTYKRDVSNPSNMDFTINNDDRTKGYVVGNGPNPSLIPINVNTNSPIILNGNLPVCFNDNTNVNGIYFLSVQKCNNQGVPVSGSTEYQKWLTNEEAKNIEKFDVKSFCDTMGCTLLNGSYYRIKLATGGVGWTERVRVIKVQTCTNYVDFTINGKSGNLCSVIEIDYNNTNQTAYDSKPMIILDASKTVSCQNAYFFSIEKCDANCNGDGNEKYKWLTQAEISDYGGLNNFDVRRFVKDKWNFDIIYNNYYRLKIATGGTWTEKTLIFHVKSCNCSTDFLINDQSRNDCTEPIEIYLDDVDYYHYTINRAAIFMHIFPTVSCNDEYFIQVEKSDAYCNGDGNPSSVWKTISFKDKYKKYEGLIDLNNKDEFPNFNFLAGNYYKVTLATGGTYTSKTVTLHINGSRCVSKGLSTSSRWIQTVKLGNFTINSGKNSGYKDYSKFCPQIPSSGQLGVELTPGCSGSCSDYCYWNIWVDLNEDNIFQTNEKLFSGNSRNMISGTITIPSGTKIGKKRMRISMKSGSNATSCQTFSIGEVEDYYVKYIGSSLKSISKDENNIGEDANSDYFVYPNPSTGIIEVSMPLETNECLIQVFNISGIEIHSGYYKSNCAIDLSNQSNGLYTIRINGNNRIVNKKIILSR